MIQTPENELIRKLKAIQPKDPDDEKAKLEAQKEHDRLLADAWTQLAGPARDALDYLLANFEGQVVQNLQSPGLATDVRQFVAGQLNAIYTVQAGLEQYKNFDPDAYEYEPQFGDPDAMEGSGDAIPY